MKKRKKQIKKRPGGGVISLFLIATFLITSYAIYKVQQNIKVSNTKVGEFKTTDVTIAAYVDGVKKDTFPTKTSGKVFEKIECTNSGTGTFNESTWSLTISGITNPTECSAYFVAGPPYTDASGATAPDLETGVIPVTWNGTDWIVANPTVEWYDYNTGWWANGVSVTSSSRSKYFDNPGTVVNMNDVLFMWVWIPRYEYQYTNLSTSYAGGSASQPGGISIKFIAKTKTSPDANYYIHNAFWWDDNNDGVKAVNEQLSGIWVAKFEISASNPTSNTLQQPRSKPGVVSWRSAQIGTFWTSIKNNMNSTTGNSVYGLSTSSDTHMMKNMEWGAVAYLSQSKYGKYGNASYTGANKEVYQNKDATYLTGFSNGTPSTGTTNTQVTYDVSPAGTGASTTGTIYGVYDMAGGAWEHVMGVLKGKGFDEPAVGANNTTGNSGFTGKLYDGTAYTGKYAALSEIGNKYYDLYENAEDGTTYDKRYHPGDATYETKGWYYDLMTAISSSKMFPRRGGNYVNNTNAGVFDQNSTNGGALNYCSTRAVLVRLL